MSSARRTILCGSLLVLTLAVQARADEVVLRGRLGGRALEARVALDPSGAPRSAEVGVFRGVAASIGPDAWRIPLAGRNALGARGRLEGERSAQPGYVLEVRRSGDGLQATWLEDGVAVTTLAGHTEGTRRRGLADLLAAQRGAGEREQVQAVQRFFSNERFPYASDADVFGRTDHWATREELLRAGRGDCEDYAFAKYFTLLELGVPPERLRVWAAHQTQQGAHMVLAYYPAPGGDPLILDNLTATILPASQRSDLRPIYSVHDADPHARVSRDWRKPDAGRAAPVTAHRDMLRRMGRDLPPPRPVTLLDAVRPVPRFREFDRPLGE